MDSIDTNIKRVTKRKALFILFQIIFISVQQSLDIKVLKKLINITLSKELNLFDSSDVNTGESPDLADYSPDS